MECVKCLTPLPDQAKFCFSCGTDLGDTAGGATASPRDQIAELQERLARTLEGRYVVQKLLGAGGMAAVFLADDLTLERAVAIKVLPPELSRDERLVERFKREAKTAAKLDHPHIIPIHRVESEGGLHYFVMKYVPGRSLDDVLEGSLQVAIDFATRVLAEAGAALGHAHKHGVVHRDVKPANIMLDGDDRVVLTDFGISKAGDVTSQLTHTGVIVGTPYYMAPEQALGGSIDGRADQYALGIVGYQLLTSQLPFTGDSAHTIIYRHIHDEALPVTTLRADVPAQIAATLGRALAKHPEERFPTMEAFVAALEGRTQVATATTPVATKRPAARGTGAATVVAGAPATASQAKTVRLTSSDAEEVPRRRRTVWAAAVATVAIAVVAAWLVPRGGVLRTAAVAPPSGVTPGVAASPTATDGAQPEEPNTADSLATRATSQPSITSSRARRDQRPAPRSQVAGPTSSTARQVAPLTVASEPYGTLYVDGVEVGDTPVANHALVVGRVYELRVEREGYRTKREKIRVEDPNPIRRRYILDPGDSR
jgi:tRNA A-37 threonylcarbamoyl transferase component Bud32